MNFIEFILRDIWSFRWKIKDDEHPILYPFLEFKKGLLLEIKEDETILEKQEELHMN